MKSVIESIRAARHIELILLVVMISTLGLFMLNGRVSGAGTENDVETRLEQLLERIDGVSGVNVMVSTDENGKPVGAVVVTRGALDVRARLEIQSAIQALLDIDLSRIRVIGKGDRTNETY